MRPVRRSRRSCSTTRRASRPIRRTRWTYRGAGENPSDGIDYWMYRTASDASTLPTPRPVYMTETGYHNAVNGTGGNAGVDEAVQAKLINRQVFDAFNAGAVKTFLYELID